jgi:hypothetical protein
MKVVLNQHDLDILRVSLHLSESDIKELVDRINSTDNLKPYIPLSKEMEYHIRNGWVAKG